MPWLLLLQKGARGEGSVPLAHALNELSKSAPVEPLAELALSLSQEYFVNEEIRGG